MRGGEVIVRKRSGRKRALGLFSAMVFSHSSLTFEKRKRPLQSRGALLERSSMKKRRVQPVSGFFVALEYYFYCVVLSVGGVGDDP